MSDIVNTGTAANSGNGDPLRNAFTLINIRFQELLGTLTGRGVWVTATVYAATPTREWVTNAGTAYVCAENHTSGTFATDLAAGKWIAADVTQLISDLAATSAAKGSEMIGSDDNASGTLWTTVDGFINRLLGANGAGMVGNTPAGSIAATTVQAAINELATEKISAGLATASGLTMSTARMLGRTTAATGAIEELTAAQIAAFTAAATDTAQGAIELLTTAEAKAGVDTTRAMTAEAMKAAQIQPQTAVTLTNQTAVDFSSIPSWANRITLLFSGVSTNGTSVPIVQLGDAGGFETSGYTGSVSIGAHTTAWTIVATPAAGFGITTTTAAGSVYTGKFILDRINGNEWIASGEWAQTTATITTNLFQGAKTLSATLTQVRLTTSGGSDQFDAGTVNALIE